jgi:hypothetical protein
MISDTPKQPLARNIVNVQERNTILSLINNQNESKDSQAVVQVMVVNKDILLEPIPRTIEQLFGFKLADFIKAVGSPICPCCKSLLSLSNLRESLATSSGILVVAVPWKSFPATLTVNVAATVNEASRVVLDGKLQSLKKVPLEKAVPHASCEALRGGVVVESLSLTPALLESNTLQQEIAEIEQKYGYPLLYCVTSGYDITSVYYVSGAWWCSVCQKGYDDKQRHFSFEYGVVHPEDSSYIITDRMASSLSLFSLTLLLDTYATSAPPATATRLKAVCALLYKSSLGKRPVKTLWKDLSLSQRYVLRVSVVALLEIALCELVLDDISLLEKSDRQFIEEVCLAKFVVTSNLKQKKTLIIEDSNSPVSKKSPCKVKVLNKQQSRRATEISATIDVDDLQNFDGTTVFQLLNLGSSFVKLYEMLPESRRRGLTTQDFISAQGILSFASWEVGRGSETLAELLDYTVSHVASLGTWPQNISTILEFAAESGYSNCLLTYVPCRGEARALRLIPWLAEQGKKNILIENPLTGTFLEEVSYFDALIKAATQRNFVISIRSRQQWVNSYYGVTNEQ